MFSFSLVSSDDIVVIIFHGERERESERERELPKSSDHIDVRHSPSMIEAKFIPPWPKKVLFTSNVRH